MSRKLFQSALLFVILFAACKRSNKKASGDIFESTYFDADEFITILQEAMPTIDSGKKKNIPSPADAMYRCYSSNDYEPFWFNAKGVSPAVEDFIKELDELKQDCLNPDDYAVENIREQYKKLTDTKEPDINAVVNFDTLCTKSYLKAARDLLMGKIRPSTVDSLWYHANDTAWTAPQDLMQHLSNADDYPGLDQFRSKIPLYATLREEVARYSKLANDADFMQLKSSVEQAATNENITAIIRKEVGSYAENATLGNEDSLLKAFQEYYGLKSSGKLDSITIACLGRRPQVVLGLIGINMERLRWMQQSLEERYVMVDIPLMKMKLMDGTKEAMSMNVVVGKTIRQTPSLSAKMTNIVFNPSWGVPPTILKKDVLPGITREGAAYLERKDLVPYTRDGEVVDADDVTPENYNQFVYKQPPGDDNSLGVVKFNLPNKWDIYLHDTPHRDDFPKKYRALSSGCIRLQEPRELANFLLTKWNDKSEFSMEKIDSVVQTHETRYEKLKNKLPVHIVYLTAFSEEQGGFHFLNDVYGRDEKLLMALVPQ